MARSYAQVKVSIWDDDSDFRTLTANAKLLYIHLISRRDLSLAGHLFTRERRWADACFGGNVDAITDAMTDLMTNGYVIVDDQTGELLVRTFIRHDGGYRNSKMRKAIEAAITKIESPKLSTVATDALARCVNGDPEPPKDQVEGQSDHQSDDQSEEASDQTTDPTLDLRPAALHPYTASSSSSELQATASKPDEDEEDFYANSPPIVTEAMNLIADQLAERNARGDAHGYKRTILADKERITAVTALAQQHDLATAKTLAAMHLGIQQAAVMADVPRYEPPPPVEVETCTACGKPCALIAITPRLCPIRDDDMRPASCATVIAPVHHLRPETA